MGIFSNPAYRLRDGAAEQPIRQLEHDSNQEKVRTSRARGCYSWQATLYSAVASMWLSVMSISAFALARFVEIRNELAVRETRPLKFEIKVEGTGGSGLQYRSRTGLPWLANIPANVTAFNRPFFSVASYFADQTCPLEPIENPFGPKVLPIRSE